MAAASKRQRGQEGEDLAVEIIQQHGLQVLMRNFRCPVGEMDIIAFDGGTLIFMEVRSRSTSKYGWGEESIQPKKRRRLQRIAEHFILMNHYQAWPPIRFDLMAIRWLNDSHQTNWIRGI